MAWIQPANANVHDLSQHIEQMTFKVHDLLVDVVQGGDTDTGVNGKRDHELDEAIRLSLMDLEKFGLTVDCVDLTSKRKFKWTEQIQEVLNISSSDSDVHLVKIIQPVSIVSSKRKRLHKSILIQIDLLVEVHDTPMNTSNSSDLPVVDLKSQKHQLDLILKASNAIKSLHEISKK
ncbi:hypothetical protein HDV02_000320, partial [Globomyces sp. JEL0801]